MSAQKQVKKKDGGVKRFLLVLLMLTLVVLYGIIYLMPTVSDAITQTAILEYDTILVSQEVTGYIVRDEVVYLADRSGSIYYYITEDDTKVRKQTKVLEIGLGSAEHNENQYPTILNRLQGTGNRPESHVTEKNNQLVTYSLDGYEGYFSSATMETLKRTEVEKLDMQVYNVVRSTTLPDEPLYKLVSDEKWYFLFWVEPEYISRYSPGEPVTLKLALGEVKGNIHSVSMDEDYGRVILQFDRAYADFTKHRRIVGTVVTEDFSGLIVPNSALASEDGQIGVYRLNVNGSYTFVPVSTIYSDGEYTLLIAIKYYDSATEVTVNTVKAYDEVLKDSNDINRIGGG